MRRIAGSPRPNWQSKVEEAGLTWHTTGHTGEQPYWNENAFYEFTAKEIHTHEAATNELEAMSLEAAQHIIDNKLYAKMGIPEAAVPLIESSWEAGPPSLYGRFDLAYDGTGPRKLLEYNADTPTSLLEAAVVQWYWLQEVFPRRDRFNSLHERLIALCKELTPYLAGRRSSRGSMPRCFRSRRSAGTGTRSWDRRIGRWARCSSSIHGNGWCTKSSASIWVRR